MGVAEHTDPKLPIQLFDQILISAVNPATPCNISAFFRSLMPAMLLRCLFCNWHLSVRRFLWSSNRAWAKRWGARSTSKTMNSFRLDLLNCRCYLKQLGPPQRRRFLVSVISGYHTLWMRKNDFVMFWVILLLMHAHFWGFTQWGLATMKTLGIFLLAHLRFHPARLHVGTHKTIAQACTCRVIN